MIKFALLTFILGGPFAVKPLSKPIKQTNGLLCAYVRDNAVKQVMGKSKVCMCRGPLQQFTIAKKGFVLGYLRIVSGEHFCKGKVDFQAETKQQNKEEDFQL